MVSKNSSEIDNQIVKERLSGHGLKVTAQRMIIYKCLLAQHDHPSAESIYERIKGEHPSISLGTVYKTMDALVASGLVKKVKTGDDLLRFDARAGNHHHLYCSRTNRIIDFEDEELQHILEAYFASRNFDNFTVSDYQVLVNGEMKNPGKNIRLKQIK